MSKVIKKFDEFTDITTIRHVDELKCKSGFFGNDGVINTYGFNLVLAKSKNEDSVFLQCNVQATDWTHLRNGRITFNCDQENLQVEFNESGSEAEHIGETLYCFERGSYQLSQPVLASICNAAVLKVRISGGSSYEEPNAEWCKKFQKYAREFYAGAIDPQAFAEAPSAPTAEVESTKSAAKAVPESAPKAASATSGVRGKIFGVLGALVLALIVAGSFAPKRQEAGRPVASVTPVVPVQKEKAAPAPVPISQQPPSSAQPENTTATTQTFPISCVGLESSIQVQRTECAVFQQIVVSAELDMIAGEFVQGTQDQEKFQSLQKQWLDQVNSRCSAEGEKWTGPYQPLVTTEWMVVASRERVSVMRAALKQDARPMPGPSFSCAKAQSVNEKLICADSELARADYELAIVYDKAKARAPDQDLFRARGRDEWKRREQSCSDKTCLVHWYTARRSELLGVATN